jgi:PAS domain S-box-containing protein
MKDPEGETANAATTIESLRFELQARQRELDGCRQFIEQMKTQRRAEDDRSELWWLSSLKRENHFSILDGLPTLVTLMTPEGELEYANRNVLEYFGSTLEELKDWEPGSTFHPDDRPDAVAEWRKSVETGRPYDFEARHRAADGVYHWFHMRGFPLQDTKGRVVLWYLLHTDIDCRKRAEALLAGEKRLLEMMATGESLSATLIELCLLAEELCPSCACCSILLLNQETGKLWLAASPSVPKAYSESIDGLAIGPDVRSCGAAAYHGKQIVASDIAIDPQWAECRDLALANGLKACWSTPILSRRNRVLGTFAMFSGKPGNPTTDDQEVIAQTTRLASIAVERKQNDTALNSSEARKTAILDSALDCIVTIDHEARITEFNPAAERTFGYSRGEVLGKRLGDVIVPPSLREQHGRGFARYLATGEARVLGRRIETTAVRADGSEFPVELAITRIPLEGPPSFTGYLRDITERKQSEEKLKRSEAYLAEAQKLSLTGSFGWSVSADEHFWSDETFRIFEYDTSTNVTLQMILKRVHPDDVPLVTQIIERASHDGQDWELEHRLLMPNGTVKHVHVVAHATGGKSGNREFVGAVMDITATRRAEEAMRRAQADLAHVSRMTTLGELAASIAHEVNQPLGSIINNANACLSLLTKAAPQISELREALAEITEGANRASAVISRVRQLSRNVQCDRSPVNVADVVTDILALTRNEAASRQVTVRTQLTGDLPPVLGDRVQLQQVLLNLVVNGMDAMDTIEASRRVLVISGRCEIRDGKSGCLVSVQDAGIGFKPQEMDRFFEAFYTTKPQGLGMGLAISRSIIEGHGGQLWAEANQGPGATFLFSLPDARNASS